MVGRDLACMINLIPRQVMLALLSASVDLCGRNFGRVTGKKLQVHREESLTSLRACSIHLIPISTPPETLFLVLADVPIYECSLKDAHGSDKKRRQEGETEEGAAGEKRVRTEIFDCESTKNGPYAGATDDYPLHMHRISIRGPPEFKPKQEEQAEEGAVTTNRVGKIPPEEQQVNEKGCDLYNNGNYCSRLDTGLGCPYFHDPEARKVALEERQNRRHYAKHKINPDAMSIDESDTDTSRRRFLQTLHHVESAYPAARLSADDGGLTLSHSPPPVAPRSAAPRLS